MERRAIKSNLVRRKSVKLKIPKDFKIETYQPVDGDILLVMPSFDSNLKSVEAVKSNLRKALPGTVKVEVLPPGVRVEIVRSS